MTIHARNLPTEGCPIPPPPPPDIRAAQRAAAQAHRIFDALCTDPDAPFDAMYRAWDVAAAADSAYYTALRAQRVVATWQGVRP
ncbi:MAG TPA: hypothetical protein VF276_10115 [Chloroflexia bacterium]